MSIAHSFGSWGIFIYVLGLKIVEYYLGYIVLPPQRLENQVFEYWDITIFHFGYLMSASLYIEVFFFIITRLKL